MSLPMLRSLYAHMDWADAKVALALREAPGAESGALELFAHILAAEHVWLARIEGRSGSVPVWPVLTLEECEEMAAENAGEFAQMLSRETEASLQREVTYTNSAAQVFTSRVVDILTHVALHGAYHRGQVSLMMRRGGGTPAPTDFIAFVRGAAAATREASPTK